MLQYELQLAIRLGTAKNTCLCYNKNYPAVFRSVIFAGLVDHERFSRESNEKEMGAAVMVPPWRAV